MYTACAYCGSAFGANRALEHTPVGRTLVFDSARGRLWVVCDACGRWNLTPIETRAEAIAECERALDAAPVKDNVAGVERGALPGVRIVRVDPANRRQLATWRYCAIARQRNLTRGVVGVAVVALLPAIPIGLMFWLGAWVALPAFAAELGILGLVRERARRSVIVDAVDESGQTHRLSRRALWSTALVSDAGGWRVEVDTRGGRAAFRGIDALRVLRAALPLTISEVTPETLRAAVSRFTDGSMPVVGDVFAKLARTARVADLALDERVSLEIATTEVLERGDAIADARALLAEWRTAEVVGEIADGLLVPDEVRRRIADLTRRPS